jgi:hypothetical protein
MGSEEHRAKVIRAFPIRTKQRIEAFIEGFSWDFGRFGPVDLVVDGERVRMRYMGFGNTKGTAVLLLQHAGGRCPRVDDLCEGIAGASEVYVERVPDDPQPNGAPAQGQGP